MTTVPNLTTATEFGGPLDRVRFDSNWTEIELTFADLAAENASRDSRITDAETDLATMKTQYNWELYFAEYLENLISGRKDGTEGPWRVTHWGVSQISTAWNGSGLSVSNGLFVTQVSIAPNMDLNTGGNNISDDLVAWVKGTSGTVYRCIGVYQNLTDGLTVFMIDPRHGTPLTDFTVGSDLFWWVEQEDTTSQTIGTQARTDHFIGSGLNSVAHFEAFLGGLAPRSGVVNAGYWDKTNWINQVSDGTRTTFRLSRPAKYQPSEVRRWTGTTWVEESGWAWAASSNSITVASPLGTAEALAVDLSHVARAVYQDRPRRVLTGIPHIIPSNGYHSNTGVNLIYDMIRVCATGAPFNYKRHGLIYSEVIDRYVSARPLVHQPLTMNSTASRGVKWWAWFCDLPNGNMGIQFAFREIVHNGTDWGDDGELIPYLSGITYTTDDNGNMVLQGVVTHDTGEKAIK